MKILLVDDHELFREGLKLLLDNLAEDLSFDQAASARQALEAIARQVPDLVLLDLHLPDASGMQALDRLRSALDSAVIVAVSAEENPELVRRVIEHGAAGFIPKHSSRAVMIAALRLILAGGTYLPAQPGRVEPAAPRPPPLTERRSALDSLTPRQADTLRLAIRGKANKVIARELGVSEATIKAHLSAIYRALGVANRTEAVYVAAELDAP